MITFFGVALAIAWSSSPIDQAIQGAGWSKTKSDSVTVYFSSALAADGKRITALVESAIGRLAVHFDSLGGMKLLSDTDLSVVLYPERNERAATGRSLSETRGNRVQLSFLSPSRYQMGALNSAGEPFDDAAWQHQITHELVTTFAQRATMQKPSGWVYFQAPNWFMQGYEEFLGHRLSPGGDERTERLRQRLKDITDPVGISERALVVPDPYLQGLFLVEMLHDIEGVDFDVRLFQSPEPEFWRAMNTEFGLTPSHLLEIWRKKNSRLD